MRFTSPPKVSSQQQASNKPATSQQQASDRPDFATVTHFEPALPPTQSPWEAPSRSPGKAQEKLRRGPGSLGEAQQRLERLRRRLRKPETRTSADPEPPGSSDDQKAALPPTQNSWEVLREGQERSREG